MNKSLLEAKISDGKSTRLIAKELNVSRSTVENYINRYNLRNFYKDTRANLKPKSRVGFKFCAKCKKEHLESEFFKTPSSNGRLGSWCKGCINLNNKTRVRKLKQQAIEYMGGQCQKCGYNKCPGAMDFHHTNPEEKDFGISKVNGKSFESIKNELDKCILLCSNCHRELHYNS